MNKKTLFSVIMLSAAFCIAASAQKYNFDRVSPGLPNIKKTEGVQAINTTVKEEAAKPKEWTIMAFINGKNNLERFALKDVNEMETIGSTDRLNMVVELGRAKGVHGDWAGEGDWVGTRRYLIQKDNDFNNVTSPVVEDLGKTDMGDYKSVIEFVNWAKAKYPAKRYMLILWNHGSGWLKSQGASVHTRGISYDDETGNNITTPQTRLILEAVGGINILASDACLMQMASINYEVRDYVDYIVASEETEPGDGYAYDLFLAKAVKGTPSIIQMAKDTVQAYADFYNNKKQSFTQAAVKANKMKGLRTATDKWVKLVMKNVAKEEVMAAVNKTLYFAYDDNKDLYDFVKNINDKITHEETKAAGEALQKYITDELVTINLIGDYQTYSWFGGSYMTEYHRAKGIAVYLPAKKYDKNYDELLWAQESEWANFVKWYLNTTTKK